MSNKPTLKIVPVEPTAKMRRAAINAKPGLDNLYKAALQASPPAPSVEEIKAALKPFANFACEPIGWCQDHGGMCNNCKVAALLAQFEAMESREGK